MSSCNPNNNKDVIPAPEIPEAVNSAIILIAKNLNVSEDAIRLIKYDPVDWEDSCLGVEQSEKVCMMVITPGYRIELESQGIPYIIHTDKSGENMIINDLNAEHSIIEEEAPGAVIKAKIFMAEKLRIDKEKIIIIAYESVNWPDGCLGIHQNNEMCIQVITPGYQVSLKFENQIYYYRTNKNGTVIRQALLPFSGGDKE